LFRQGREYLRAAIGKLANASQWLWNSFWETFKYQPLWSRELGTI
jgi:hypothetical protein